MNRNSNPRARSSGGNNNAYPSNWEEGLHDSMTFRQLNPDEKAALLRDNGCLCGIRIDDSSNPRRSTFQVAQRRSTGPIPARETNEIDTEVIKTKTERETNYVHKGWSLPAISVKSPWVLSRIASTNHVSQDVPSITKRVTTRRLRVEVPLEDLKPAPEFEADVIAALEKSNNFEKFQALQQAFERWGDVVPIVFDLGVSLTTTDIQSSAERYLNERSYFGLRQLTTSGTAKISTQGGNPTVLDSDVQAWLHLPVSTSQWSQVGIIKVVPVTDLLSGRITAQLSELHKSLITYTPVTLGGVTADGRSFDDTSHALKTISTVTVCCDGYYVKSLSITYRDGTSSDKHGGAGGSSNVFELTPGENITELVVWKDTKWVYAIQMITDTGRTSKHYGGDGGTPTILRSTTPGGCLAAFSGVIQADTVHQVQAIWRHDVRCASLSGERQYSNYYGGVSGSAFNDWPLVKHADSSYVSTIRVKCGTYIAGIQVTYATNQNRIVRRQKAPYHGGASGSERTFQLDPDEHIVTIIGRRNKYIVQLCFVTNRGRTSDIYGGGDGEDFVCRAPSTSEGKPMRLHYILGKSGDWLNGVQFVWAPL